MAEQPKRAVRMPIGFSPSPGPRWTPAGERFENSNSPEVFTITMKASLPIDQYETLVFAPFRSTGDPTLSIKFTQLKRLEWLGGRGYNMLGVSVPASFKGDEDSVDGELLLVLWENRPEPIITGREELGFAKVFAELPDPEAKLNGIVARAEWEGFTFCEMEVRDLRTVEPVDAPVPLLHYKHVPATEEWGGVDVGYPTMTPANRSSLIRSTKNGEASFSFKEGTFQELPTLYPIVNRLASLDFGPVSSAIVSHSIGASDHRGQRRLR